jgi:putative transposase
MRGPKPPALTLSTIEQHDLTTLAQAHSTPQQIALRARLVLAAAAGANNADLARQFLVSVDTARLWRTRWRGLQPIPLADLSVADRLCDVPRPGRPPQIGAEQVCQIVALGCEAPSLSGRPISQWSAREIAVEVVQRGIVAHISPRHAARLLKRGISSPIGFAIG